MNLSPRQYTGRLILTILVIIVLILAMVCLPGCSMPKGDGQSVIEARDAAIHLAEEFKCTNDSLLVALEKAKQRARQSGMELRRKEAEYDRLLEWTGRIGCAIDKTDSVLRLRNVNYKGIVHSFEECDRQSKMR
jgi:cell division protein FtsX